jgi:hypothetical protein
MLSNLLQIGPKQPAQALQWQVDAPDLHFDIEREVSVHQLSLETIHR